MQNFSERQILWSLCSVDFHTFTLHLPIQTLHSVEPELQILVSSLENCQNFSKTSTPQRNNLHVWRFVQKESQNQKNGNIKAQINLQDNKNLEQGQETLKLPPVQALLL